MSMSTTESTTPRIPDVGEYVRNVGRLIEVQDVTPKPVPREIDYIFEDTDARVEARINGKVIETFSTFNNFYGDGTCVEHAIEEAKRVKKHYDPSDLEVVVVKITSRRRMRPNHRENFYDRSFVQFESLKYGASHGLPDDVEEVVWSSKTGNVSEDR